MYTRTITAKHAHSQIETNDRNAYNFTFLLQTVSIGTTVVLLEFEVNYILRGILIYKTPHYTIKQCNTKSQKLQQLV